MSAILDHQNAFLTDVARLIIWAQGHSFTLSAGETWRPQEMQDIYYRTGKSKAKVSYHTSRLAIDLNIFLLGALATLDQIRPMGTYWESLAPGINRWGGNFSTIKDGPHFERYIPGLST